MKRTSVFLTTAQIKRLQVESKKSGFKAAEMIRRFIDRGLERKEDKHGS